MNIKFKRDLLKRGRFNMAFNNDLRSYNAMINNETIGFVSNVSCYALSGNDSRDWEIWFMSKPGFRNFKLKKVFKESEIEEAKEYLIEAYQTILENKDGKYDNIKEKIKIIE